MLSPDSHWGTNNRRSAGVRRVIRGVAAAGALAVALAGPAVAESVTLPEAAERVGGVATGDRYGLPTRLPAPEIGLAKRFLFWGGLGAVLAAACGFVLGRGGAAAALAAGPSGAAAAAGRRMSDDARSAASGIGRAARAFLRRAVAILMFMLAAIVCGAAVAADHVGRAVAARRTAGRGWGARSGGAVGGGLMIH